MTFTSAKLNERKQSHCKYFIEFTIKIFNQVVTSKKLTEIDPKQYLGTDIRFKLPKGQTFE